MTAAAVSAASGTGTAALPERCIVSASISPVDPTAPKILLRVALPTVWNTKAVMFGGGGFDGSIPNVDGNVPAGPTNQPTPVGRGYATFASDSGHQANALGSQDGLWGLNDEAVRNFGGDALKKTGDALASIQRWPAEWDGAIAWYPAWNDAAALLFGVRASPTASSASRRNANATFDPSTATYNGAPLRCAGGADTGNTCLSDAQIAALKTLNTSARFNFVLASGETQYPGYNVWGSDLGITVRRRCSRPSRSSRSDRPSRRTRCRRRRRT